MWIFTWINFSWCSCSVWGKTGWLNWFWQPLCEGLSSFNPKGFCYSMHGLAVYVKDGLPFAPDFTAENSQDFMFPTGFTSSIVLLLFLLQSPSSFCSISSNIAAMLSINQSANFNIHHKDRLINSDVTDRLGELCYNFFIWNVFIQMVDFAIRIPD